jgi:hypothetical protein
MFANMAWDSFQRQWRDMNGERHDDGDEAQRDRRCERTSRSRSRCPGGAGKWESFSDGARASVDQARDQSLSGAEFDGDLD